MSLWLVYQAFKLLTGKEAWATGDFKLFAALGAWFGWTALVPIILMASIIGAVVGIAMKFSSGLREGGYVPFGPFLAGAGLTAMIFGPASILAVSDCDMAALRVGLTGGIGSGKSTVLQMLRELGAAVIDADAISRETTSARGLAIAAIAEHFGADFITPPARSTANACASELMRTPKSASSSRASSIPWSGRKARAGCRPRWTQAPGASSSISRCWWNRAAGARKWTGCSWWTARRRPRWTAS
jgi:hypothetical protein